MKPSKLKHNDRKNIISSEYFENDRPSYICSICNQTLVRLTDAGMNNSTWWCRNCSVEFDPTQENIRTDSKLSVPDRNEETLVAHIPGVNEDAATIRHVPPIRGGFAELQGIKITDYRTTEKE